MIVDEDCLISYLVIMEMEPCLVKLIQTLNDKVLTKTTKKYGVSTCMVDAGCIPP